MSETTRWRRWVAIAACVLTSSPAAAQPGPDPNYPYVANQIGMPGEVVLRCLATREGLVNNCSVASEAPTGFGFGDAALRNAGNIRVPTVTDPAAPMSRVVMVPVRFHQPKAMPLPPVTSPAALDLARGLTVLQAPIEHSLRGYQLSIDRVLSGDDANIPAEIRQAAAAAMRKAVGSDAAAIRDAAAAAVAAVFTEEELLSIKAFYTSPAGQRWAEANAQAELIRPRFREGMSERIAHASGRAYCVTRKCDTASHDARSPGSAVPWTRSPDLAELHAAAPILATTLGLPSRAVISCALLPSGAVSDCSVLSESPRGLNVGAAGLTLAKAYRADRQTAANLAGQSVVIAIDFPVEPEPSAMADASAPRSPRTLALAREIQANNTTPALQARSKADAMSFIPQAWFLGVSDEDRAAYLDAAAQGLSEVHSQIDARMIQTLASLLDESDLEAARQFSLTVGGRAMRGKGRALADANRALSRRLFLMLSGDAHDYYCKAMLCTTASTGTGRP